MAKEQCLKWNPAPGETELFLIAKETIVIGRRSDVDVVLPFPTVSRQHATITNRDSQSEIIDLGSTHGTWVNGDKISRHKLKPRDRIRLGQQGIEITYLAGDEAALAIREQQGSSDIDESYRHLTTLMPNVDPGRSELEKMMYVLDFHYSVGRNFSAEKTFQHILKSALQLSGAERGFVLRKGGDDFRFVVGMDVEGRPVEQTEFRASRTIVDRVAETHTSAFMMEGLPDDLAGQASVVAMNLRAIACLPLETVSGDSEEPEVRGILYLDSSRRMHSLTGLDERILRKLAQEAGNVIEKLDLIESLEERRKLEQELAIAQATQRALLPSSLPNFDGFLIRGFSRATRYVGGDLYEFILLESGELVGVLADVSGKGIPAALLGSLTTGALNMEFRSSRSPGEVLTKVNRVLCDKTEPSRFVTLVLFQVDSEGNGRYVSAGHNPAFLYRAATGEVEEVSGAGLPLGMFSFATYDATPLRLETGDILVLYSDGVTEAEDPEQNMFGEPRLRTIIAREGAKGSGAVESELLRELEEFTRGAAQNDDMTFVLMEREPRHSGA